MKNTFNTNLAQYRTHSSRNLLFCFDGTWNDPTDAYEKGSDITNVLKIHNAAVQDDDQLSFYFSGVGTGGGLDKIVGGATGAGAKKIRNQGYVELVKNYRPGDRIFVFGFSRGAAIARMFAGLVAKEGIPETLEFSKNGKRFKAKGAVHHTNIEMMGIFDTVASFGLAVEVAGLDFQRVDLFKDFTVGAHVNQTYHLVALHEGRRTFRPTLTNHSPNVEEIWFPGVHADVGGGYADDGLSDIALQYMVDRCQERNVRFTAEKLAEIRPNITGLMHDKVKEEYALGMEHRDVHVIEGNKKSDHPPKIHHTVFERMKRFSNRVPRPIERLNGNYQQVGKEQEA